MPNIESESNNDDDNNYELEGHLDDVNDDDSSSSSSLMSENSLSLSNDDESNNNNENSSLYVNKRFMDQTSTEYCAFVKKVLELLDQRDAEDIEYIRNVHSNNDNNDKQQHRRHFSSDHVNNKLKSNVQLLRTNSNDDIQTSVIIKAGPLMKSSYLGNWKLKYVEIVRGKFTYFNDRHHVSSSDRQRQDSVAREKNIRLIADHYSCRIIELESKFAFELTYGERKRIWITHTRDELHGWMRAIHEATIGRSVTRSDNFFEYQYFSSKKNNDKQRNIIPPSSRYQSSMKKFLNCQKGFRSALSKEMYIEYIEILSSSCQLSSFCIPVEWVKAHFYTKNKANEIESNRKNNSTSQAFIEDVLATSVKQLQKDLQRDVVHINERVYRGGDEDSSMCMELIIGGLAQSIMEKDEASSYSSSSRITEIQAIAFARDILLACNRTRSGGDMFFTIQALCAQPDLVVVCPRSVNATDSPLSINVKNLCNVSRKLSLNPFNLNEKTDWVYTRTSVDQQWEKSYCILSGEGLLFSFYAHELPKPHKLRGQILLDGAVTGVNKTIQREKLISDNTSGFVLYICSADRSKEVHLNFENEEELFSWQRCLNRAIKLHRSNNQSAPYVPYSSTSNSSSTKYKVVDGFRRMKAMPMLAFSSAQDEIRRGLNGSVSSRRLLKSKQDRDISSRSHRRNRTVPNLILLTSDLLRRNKHKKSISLANPYSINSNGENVLLASPTTVDGDNELNEVCEVNNASEFKSIKSTVVDERPFLNPKPLNSQTMRRSATVPCSDSERNFAARNPRHDDGLKEMPQRPRFNSYGGSKSRPSVLVDVRVSSEFKVCTIDPNGSNEDTWIYVRMIFIQHFILRGGRNGKIVRGEEIAKIEVI